MFVIIKMKTKKSNRLHSTCSELDTVDVCEDGYCHVSEERKQNLNDDTIQDFHFNVNTHFNTLQLKSAAKIKFYVLQ